MCPSGWEWEGDWEMSKVLQAFAQGKASDAFNYKEVNLQWTKILNPSNSYFWQECYEIDSRYQENPWKIFKFITFRYHHVKSLEDIKCPRHWVWSEDWKISLEEDVDDEGKEFIFAS